MIGRIICSNGKVYPIGQIQKVTMKSIESTRKEGNKNIWDLVLVNKDKEIFLAMPDILKKNYSFLRALSTGKSFRLELDKVKGWDGTKIFTVDLNKKYKPVINGENNEFIKSII